MARIWIIGLAMSLMGATAFADDLRYICEQSIIAKNGEMIGPESAGVVAVNKDGSNTNVLSLKAFNDIAGSPLTLRFGFWFTDKLLVGLVDNAGEIHEHTTLHLSSATGGHDRFIYEAWIASNKITVQVLCTN